LVQKETIYCMFSVYAVKKMKTNSREDLGDRKQNFEQKVYAIPRGSQFILKLTCNRNVKNVSIAKMQASCFRFSVAAFLCIKIGIVATLAAIYSTNTA
ncbi:hypothetical protein T4C_11580, partial [Trichinella pseudospiralis]